MRTNLKGGNEARGQVRKRLSTVPACLLPLLRLLASSFFLCKALPLLVLSGLSLWSLSISRSHAALPLIFSLRSMGALTHAHANILAPLSPASVLIVLHLPRAFSFSVFFPPRYRENRCSRVPHSRDSRTPTLCAPLFMPIVSLPSSPFLIHYRQSLPASVLSVFPDLTTCHVLFRSSRLRVVENAEDAYSSNLLISQWRSSPFRRYDSVLCAFHLHQLREYA